MTFTDEELTVHYIPTNFVDKGRILNGMFRTRNFVEACIVTAPLLLALFFVTGSIPTNWRIMVVLAPAILLFMVAVVGVNGDSLFEFVAHVMTFNRRKRVAKYNGRVKHEFEASYISKTRSNTPVEEFVEKVRNLVFGEDGENYEDFAPEADSDSLFFEEDIGIEGIETPDALKSRKELRREMKERKRIEKEARRARIQEEKRRLLIEEEADRIVRQKLKDRKGRK